MASTPKKRTLADGTAVWDVRVYLGGGKYENKTFDTEKAARSFGGNRETDKRRGRVGDPRRARQTIKTYGEAWYDKREGLWSPATARRYGFTLQGHIYPLVGGSRLESFTRDDALLFVSRLLKSGRSRSTAAEAVTLLSSVFESAVTAEVLVRNPFGRGKQAVSVGAIDRRDPVFLTAEQLDDLAGRFDERWRRWRGAVLLGGWGGMRYGEVFGLRRRYLVDDCTRVLVREQLTWPKNRARIGAPLKTPTSRREVAVDDWIAEELRAHLRTVSLDPNALVFSGMRGGPMRPEVWNRCYWQPTVAGLEVPGMHFHDLRHTCASIAAANGATIHAVSKFLGHANVSITQNLYTHLFGDAGQHVVAAMRAARAGDVVPIRRPARG